MEWTDLYDDPRDTCSCRTCESDMAYITPCMAETTNEYGEERA